VSRENVEVAKRFYAAGATVFENVAAGGDIDDTPEYWELVDPDVVLVEVAEFPDAATYRGIDQVRRWLQAFFDIFDEISVEPQDFLSTGDRVVVSTHQRFRSKAGVEVEQDITQVLQFRDGRVIYATGYRDRSNALKAVGLEE
jgi:ketosteroid isomerase-like protein